MAGQTDIGLPGLTGAYRLRWKRRRFLFRIWRKKLELTAVADRTKAIAPSDILLFATVRNEMQRLPYFLQHYRNLGVRHFLIVDNGSTDGSAAYLRAQDDVSLWSTDHSYKLSRFGMDWIGWLQLRHGHGHWCLTVDADELLVYPDVETRALSDLTAWLDRAGQHAMGALLLDLYPRGPVTAPSPDAARDPLSHLQWFDPDGYRSKRHPYYGNAWIQGGVRERMFFRDAPERAPSLNKIPLVRWDRRFAYVSSTHQILPRRLHLDYDLNRPDHVSGVLLHTKFLPDIGARSAEETQRRQHFENSALYQDYYRDLQQGPTLWQEGSARYFGSHSLVQRGLMSKGNWV